MNLLETMIQSWESKQSNVISEVHDLGKIQVDLSAVDSAMARLSGGRVWDAREYGISEAEARQRIEAANTPEARERVMNDLRERAIRRAGLDTSNGRVNVFVAGNKPAWHAVGVHVREAVSSREAQRLGGLGFRVAKYPTSYLNPITGLTMTNDDSFVVLREDTGAYLGTVGSKHRSIQNDEAFGLLDDVLGEFGAKYESAGSLYGGKKVWMLVKLPAQEFRVNGTDVVEPYACFMNPHDGSGAAKCFPTALRIECANTLRMAINAADKGISIRHSGNVKSKINQAKKALGLAVQEFTEFANVSQVMATTKLEARPYFDSVLDEVLDITAAEVAKGAPALALEETLRATDSAYESRVKELEREMKNRRSILDDILERYDSRTNGTNGMRGSAWSAFNAVTESADHGALGGRFVGDKQTRASRRFESVLTGRADEAKQVAFETVKAIVG